MKYIGSVRNVDENLAVGMINAREAFAIYGTSETMAARLATAAGFARRVAWGQAPTEFSCEDGSRLVAGFDCIVFVPADNTTDQGQANTNTIETLRRMADFVNQHGHTGRQAVVAGRAVVAWAWAGTYRNDGSIEWAEVQSPDMTTWQVIRNWLEY